jgi:hypothetical protein
VHDFADKFFPAKKPSLCAFKRAGVHIRSALAPSGLRYAAGRVLSFGGIAAGRTQIYLLAFAFLIGFSCANLLILRIAWRSRCSFSTRAIRI